MDMRRPLCDYFIASSHNTYLEADQLRGPASVHQYISVLCAGCRCVELDLWEGPDGAGPVITHGHTLVRKIALRDVLEAIAAYAFRASEFPLILSFENHCGFEQQAVVADLCVELLVTKAERQAFH